MSEAFWDKRKLCTLFSMYGLLNCYTLFKANKQLKLNSFLYHNRKAY